MLPASVEAGSVRFVVWTRTGNAPGLNPPGVLSGLQSAEKKR